MTAVIRAYGAGGAPQMARGPRGVQSRSRSRIGSSLRGAEGRGRVKGARARRGGGQHPLEALHRLLHLVHRSECDAAVSLLERRKIAANRHLERRARLTELAGGALQVDEDAVGMRVGSLVSEALECA